MINRPSPKTIAIVIGLTVIGLGLGIFTARQQKLQLPPQIQGMMWPNPKVLKTFSSVDHNGKEFGLQNLQGNWSFLFFGYSHCPDICPVTLTILDQVYEKLQAKQQQPKVQVVFVSVDPERDTSERLHSYVSYFNEDFIGLGGSLEQIKSLTGQMGIAFFHEPPSASGDYSVDHTAAIFLIDPKGEMIAIMSAPHKVDDIVSRFVEIQSFIEKQTQI